MTVAIINGSPRKEQGISAALIKTITEKLPGCEIRRGWASCAAGEPCEAYLFVFPLYVDGIPSNLLRELVAHEGGMPPGARVYAVLNNGFYEGAQNAPAIAMLRSWCVRAGLAWGQAVGIGAGELLKREAVMALGKALRGPMKEFCRALDTLAGNILAGGGGADIYPNGGMPRWIYILGGNISMRQAGKQNGLTKREMERRLPIL